MLPPALEDFTMQGLSIGNLVLVLASHNFLLAMAVGNFLSGQAVGNSRLGLAVGDLVPGLVVNDLVLWLAVVGKLALGSKVATWCYLTRRYMLWPSILK
jgi:hypothetical protein